MGKTKQLEIVQKFQCPGCGAGLGPESGCFKSDPATLSCANHSAGTFVAGIGRVNLGLPKGFSRLGAMDSNIQRTNIRILEELPKYNEFNIPLWAMEYEEYLLVVVALPRLQFFWIDIVPGKKISDLPSTVIDVSKLDLSECCS